MEINMPKYIEPKVDLDVFTCPYCAVTSQQEWEHIDIFRDSDDKIQVTGYDISELRNLSDENQSGICTSWCLHCGKAALWESEKIVYPLTGIFPPPHEDLPEDIKGIYNEAGSIANTSPRAACALFRVAIEMLLNHIGKKGNINDNIKKLVQEGLHPKFQKILDILRVTGNNAVHPGIIKFDDITSIASFYDWINMVTDILITQPAEIERIYDSLPEKDRKVIEKRDN